LVGSTLEVFIQPKASAKDPNKFFDTVYINNLIAKPSNSELNF